MTTTQCVGVIPVGAELSQPDLLDALVEGMVVVGLNGGHSARMPSRPFSEMKLNESIFQTVLFENYMEKLCGRTELRFVTCARILRLDELERRILIAFFGGLPANAYYRQVPRQKSIFGHPTMNRFKIFEKAESCPENRVQEVLLVTHQSQVVTRTLWSLGSRVVADGRGIAFINDLARACRKLLPDPVKSRIVLCIECRTEESAVFCRQELSFCSQIDAVVSYAIPFGCDYYKLVGALLN